MWSALAQQSFLLRNLCTCFLLFWYFYNSLVIFNRGRKASMAHLIRRWSCNCLKYLHMNSAIEFKSLLTHFFHLHTYVLAKICLKLSIIATLCTRSLCPITRGACSLNNLAETLIDTILYIETKSFFISQPCNFLEGRSWNIGKDISQCLLIALQYCQDSNTGLTVGNWILKFAHNQ